MTDPTLLCCQAVLFLRRGDIDKAISYYVDVLDYEPGNKIALSAMDFIRLHGTYEEVCKIVDTGEIERFYPPLGVNPDFIRRIVLSVLAGLALAFLIVNFGNFSRLSGRLAKKDRLPVDDQRSDLSSLFLSVDELENAQKKEGVGSVKYKLTDAAIKRSYDTAMNSFKNHKENAAQIEINRLLNSNASDAIKEKAKMISAYFEAHTFDTLSEYDDNIEYSQVRDAKEPEIYIGCIVAWGGYFSNVVEENGTFRCDLFVGDEERKRVDGVVGVAFQKAPVPPLDSSRAVYILGKVKSENGKILLEGRSVYQPLKK
ncbi:MAG: hypothetical protein IJ727_06190 [Treponema sp.]|nr:hypothetical protein [Treponema sp.]